MAANLKTTKYNDGSSIAYPGDDDEAWVQNTNGAYAWYGNDIANKDVWGALYNWHAVNTLKLCPSGWHVPNDLEWTALTDFLASEGHDGTQGAALKAETGWLFDGNGTDNYGFAALPGGYRHVNGYFNYEGTYGYWWSSTATNESWALYRYIQGSNQTKC